MIDVCCACRASATARESKWHTFSPEISSVTATYGHEVSCANLRCHADKSSEHVRKDPSCNPRALSELLNVPLGNAARAVFSPGRSQPIVPQEHRGSSGSYRGSRQTGGQRIVSKLPRNHDAAQEAPSALLVHLARYHTCQRRQGSASAAVSPPLHAADAPNKGVQGLTCRNRTLGFGGRSL